LFSAHKKAANTSPMGELKNGFGLAIKTELIEPTLGVSIENSDGRTEEPHTVQRGHYYIDFGVHLASGSKVLSPPTALVTVPMLSSPSSATWLILLVFNLYASAK